MTPRLRHIVPVGALGLLLGAVPLASAASFNWGNNGSGTCTNGAGSEWNAGNCVMSLSGWVSVRGWTIYGNPQQSCQDTIDGPYPTVPGGNNQSPSNLQSGPFYGSVQYFTNSQTGWAWQGSNITGDLANNVPVEGQINTSNGQVTTWGTGTGSFGDSSPESSSAQYAAGCVNVAGAGQLSGLTTNARETATTAVAMVKANAHPGERLLRYSLKNGGRGVQRRVTLKPNSTRVVSVVCPAGTRRRASYIWDEVVTPDGKRPVAAKIKAADISVSKQSRARDFRVTVTTGKLPYPDMLQMQIACK